MKRELIEQVNCGMVLSNFTGRARKIALFTTSTLQHGNKKSWMVNKILTQAIKSIKSNGSFQGTTLFRAKLILTLNSQKKHFRKVALKL